MSAKQPKVVKSQKASQKKKKYMVVVSDLHVNSTRGLWPQSFDIEDGNTVIGNKFQASLWTWWNDFWKWANEFTGGEYELVINGDLHQGVHTSKDIQIISASHKDMRRAVTKVLEPALTGASKIYIVRGTDWHDGKGGEDTESIAQDIDAVMDEQTQQYSFWILWKRFEGHLFHFTHHVSVSSDYPLTALRKEIDRAKREYFDHGQPMPEIQVRSHRHQSDHAEDGKYHVFVTPAWQLQTAYVVKRNPLSLPDIGGMIFYTDEEGELQWKTKLYQMPTPRILD